MAFEGAPPGRPHPLPAPKGSRLPDHRHRDAAHAKTRLRVGLSQGQVPLLLQGWSLCSCPLPGSRRNETQRNKCVQMGFRSLQSSTFIHPIMPLGAILGLQEISTCSMWRFNQLATEKKENHIIIMMYIRYFTVVKLVV